MSEHWPEPWKLDTANLLGDVGEGERDYNYTILDANDGLVFRLRGEHEEVQRVLACVNELANVPIEHMEPGRIRELLQRSLGLLTAPEDEWKTFKDAVTACDMSLLVAKSL